MIKSDLTDANSQIILPKMYMGAFFPNFSLIIKLPEYGSFFIETESFDNKIDVVVPAINKKSQYFERSIWGIIAAENGQPVAGALVKCNSIQSQSSPQLPHTILQESNMALTDEEGRFSMYMPLWELGTMKLIPPLSKYSINIIPPANSHLLSFVGQIQNGQESKIVLLAQPGMFRKFVFEDANGPITDKRILGDIVIQPADKKGISSRYVDWRSGRNLPEGKYTAVVLTPTFKLEVQKPVEVSKSGAGCI